MVGGSPAAGVELRWRSGGLGVGAVEGGAWGPNKGQLARVCEDGGGGWHGGDVKRASQEPLLKTRARLKNQVQPPTDHRNPIRGWNDGVEMITG